MSKHNSTRQNQVLLLMITDNKTWQYLAVKSLPAFFRAKTSRNNGDSYCLTCFHSFRTKNQLKEHENVCENHNYCYTEIPKEESILKDNHGEKSMKVPFIIYADMESLLNKIYTRHNNPKKSSMTKINKHTAFDYSLLTHCSFDVTKSKHHYYRGKDYMNNLCKDLRKHATKIFKNEEN